MKTPTTKSRKREKKYTLKEVKQAIKRAYLGASSDSWNIPYVYESILQARIARDLRAVSSPNKK